MHVLIVYCHPLESSFSAALRNCARDALKAAGHEVKVLDLYEENFDPVMSAEERSNYLTNADANFADVSRHIELLRWAEGLVFVYPTWFYGPPARLKGWLERTWLPGVAFTIPQKKGERAGPGMQHIRWLCCVTTSGSPWWWLRLIRDPGRMLFVRGLRALFSRRCKVTWLQLHNMNNVTEKDTSGFLHKVYGRLVSIR